MKRKRAPGGGRKPLGVTPMTETLTTRISKETRDALEAAAARGSRSVSREVELRLKLSLDMDVVAGEPKLVPRTT